MSAKSQPCRVCGRETLVMVNITFTPVPVCERCCLAITKQEVASWALINVVATELQPSDGAGDSDAHVNP